VESTILRLTTVVIPVLAVGNAKQLIPVRKAGDSIKKIAAHSSVAAMCVKLRRVLACGNALTKIYSPICNMLLTSDNHSAKLDSYV
jgi:hypothetical protein